MALQQVVTPFRILIVDDDENGAMAVQLLLRKYGYEVFTAQDGHKGVESARRLHPDLILMDLSMPVCNGYQATEILRQNGEFSETPIIGYSAYVGHAESEALKLRGFDDLIVKPVMNMMLVVDTVQYWLKSRRVPS